MMDGAMDPFDLRTAVKTIKTAILKSRYVAAKAANAEMQLQNPVDAVSHRVE